MRRILLPLLMAASCIACSLVRESEPAVDSGGDGESYAGLGLQVFPGYQACFELRFDGTYSWRYRLETAVDGQVTEQQLHLEGLSEALDPGDIRAVLDPDRVSMRGPGTDDQCLSFPADPDASLSFLTPDDLFEPSAFDASLVTVGTGEVAGREATQYALSQTILDGWTDIDVHIWLDEITGAVLRYELSAQGDDPLFDAGSGLISGEFVVRDIGSQDIDPIPGCEIELPLPPEADRVTKLPGLISFEADVSSASMIVFYEVALPDEGWEELAEPQIGTDGTLLSYGRGDERLDISIEARADAIRVELWVSTQ
jgi:hypothetical protein